MANGLVQSRIAIVHRVARRVYAPSSQPPLTMSDVENAGLRYLRADPMLFGRRSAVPFEKGERKWPGRLPKLSKYQWVWKLTCMHVRPANSRLRQLHIFTEVAPGCDQYSRPGTARSIGGRLRDLQRSANSLAFARTRAELRLHQGLRPHRRHGWPDVAAPSGLK